MLVVQLVARAIGLDVGLLECLALVPLALLVAMLLVSIGGWGVREGAFVAAFGLVGVPACDAFGLSVIFGLAVIVAELPGGLVWLLMGASAPSQRLAVRERSASACSGRSSGCT